MAHTAILIGLLAVLIAVSLQNRTTHKKLTTMAETLDTRFDGIEASLTEASTEIQKQIEDLRNAQGTLTPEQEEKLSAIEATATGLANLVPNDETPPTEGEATA